MSGVHINAGDLDQQITLQERAADTRDAHGQANGAWVAAFTDIWARADTRPGGDYFAAGQEHATMQVTFRIRYREGVHERMRVLWKGQLFELVGRPINIKGAGVALDLPCVAGSGEGR
jgi:SPP1 family predicted phage head-tail adaptor